MSWKWFPSPPLQQTKDGGRFAEGRAEAGWTKFGIAWLNTFIFGVGRGGEGEKQIV